MSTMPIMRTGREGHGGPGCAAWIEPATDFGAVLRRIRSRTRLPQTELAERADVDHSYVSRLESGSRMPTRDAVGRLANALGGPAAERRELLRSAGFLPDDEPPLDPLLAELNAILTDPDLAPLYRHRLRREIDILLGMARLVAQESEDK